MSDVRTIDSRSDRGMAPPRSASAADHPVLRSTYRLLSLTLAFSAVTAVGTAALGLQHPGLLLTLAGYFGLLFLTSYLRNSAWGLASVFALTGFMGYTLGPLLGAYLALPNGAMTVGVAMGLTGTIFLALSAYARSERAVDMLRFGNFLFIGILTAFGLGLAAVFMELPMLSLAARRPDVGFVGLEVQPDMAALAAINISSNGCRTEGGISGTRRTGH